MNPVVLDAGVAAKWFLPNSAPFKPEGMRHPNWLESLVVNCGVLLSAGLVRSVRGIVEDERVGHRRGTLLSACQTVVGVDFGVRALVAVWNDKRS
jgi:hypothetical protein